MIFVKLQNGNVKVTTAGGDTLIGINDTGVRCMVVGPSGDIIQIMQDNYPIFTFNVSEVTAYQILPAASVAFAGTAPQFVDILMQSFFLAEIDATISGTVDVNVVSPNPLPVIADLDIDKSAFGESVFAQLTAFVQNNGAYEFLPSNFRSYTSGVGSGTGIVNRMFAANNGTAVGGFGAIQSFRALNYNSGQGGRARFTAVFPSNVANHWSGVGLVNLSDELSFGYDGTTFGIWHRKEGVAEVRTITVTAAATTATNLTLTLNGIAYTIPLTVTTTAGNAYEIATWLNANQSLWVADQIGSTVIISAKTDGAKAGVYSYVHANSTGTITQNKAGVTKTSTHIPKANWNRDTMSTLDPTKGNVYQISYPYLGFGGIKFFVKEKGGTFKLVHVIEYENTYTTPSLRQPSLRFGVYSASTGTTTDVPVYCASVALFVEGEVRKTRNPRAFGHTQSVTTTFTNVLTIRNRRTYNYIYNQVEIEPIHLSISSESNQNVLIEIRTNPTFSGATNFVNTGTNLVSDVDTTANTVSGGTLLAAFTVGAKGTLSVNLKEFEIRQPPSLQLCISAKVTSGAASNVTATLTYYEDI